MALYLVVPFIVRARCRVSTENVRKEHEDCPATVTSYRIRLSSLCPVEDRVAAASRVEKERRPPRDARRPTRKEIHIAPQNIATCPLPELCQRVSLGPCSDPWSEGSTRFQLAQGRLRPAFPVSYIKSTMENGGCKMRETWRVKSEAYEAVAAHRRDLPRSNSPPIIESRKSGAVRRLPLRSLCSADRRGTRRGPARASAL